MLNNEKKITKYHIKININNIIILQEYKIFKTKWDGRGKRRPVAIKIYNKICSGLIRIAIEYFLREL